MPHRSPRQLALRRLDELLALSTKHIHTLWLMGIQVDDAKLDFVWKCKALRHKIQNNRFFLRGSYKKRSPKFHIYLLEDESNPESLSPDQFLFHFRVTRETFGELVNLIRGHSVFQRSSDARGKHQKPASHQLLVLLKCFGSQGNQACSMALSTFFGVGKGVIDYCRKNALEALLALEEQTYFWPTAEERKAMSNQIKEKHLFPHCVGLIDGTLLPLATKPELHGENYLSRKRFHAIVMLVVCDDQARITHCHVGWPGSVHDNRVWRTCNLHNNRHQMFSPKEHLLGDSAFTPSVHMVPPFKTCPGQALDANQTAFNTLLASPRVKSEHCIGILKGRFPLLRSIPLKLASRSDMRRIVNHVRGAVVLHNFSIKEDIMEDWIQPEEPDLDDEESNRDSDGEANDKRRSDLLFCLSELEDSGIN